MSEPTPERDAPKQDAPAPAPGPPPGVVGSGRGSLVLGSLIIFAGLFVIVYRALVAARLDRSAAMFVGVPMLIGLFATMTHPKGAIGATMKYITISMCLLAPMLGEGAVCLLMAAPIVYPIAALAAWGLTRSSSTARCVVGLPFLYAVLVQPSLEELPVVEATDSIELASTPDRVFLAMEGLAVPLAAPPLFLRVGFPRPVELISGGALEPGAERRVVFDNGTVVARVTAVEPGQRIAVKLSYENPGHEFFDRWLYLDDAVFTFEPLPGGRTRMTHTTHYRRLLNPALYFGPLEQYGVHTMQRYLLSTFARHLAAGAPPPL